MHFAKQAYCACRIRSMPASKHASSCISSRISLSAETLLLLDNPFEIIHNLRIRFALIYRAAFLAATGLANPPTILL